MLFDDRGLSLEGTASLAYVCVCVYDVHIQH